jgi:hypothetical protein
MKNLAASATSVMHAMIVALLLLLPSRSDCLSAWLLKT